MHFIPELFAVGLLEKIRALSATKSGGFQTLVFFGAFAAIALAVFCWAVIFRKQPLRRHHRSHSKPSASSGEAATGTGFLSRHRHKHRRHKHRPVNPTLAETGGLPAARDNQTPPKSHL